MQLELVCIGVTQLLLLREQVCSTHLRTQQAMPRLLPAPSPKWYVCAQGNIDVKTCFSQGASTQSPVSQTLTCLLEQVWANISLSTIYPDCDGGQGQTGKTGWGLFDMESVPGAVTWRPLTYAFAAFGELAQVRKTPCF